MVGSRTMTGPIMFIMAVTTMPPAFAHRTVRGAHAETEVAMEA